MAANIMITAKVSWEAERWRLQLNGDKFSWMRGTCSPLGWCASWWTILFQGRILGSVPIIKPVKNTSVKSRNKRNSQNSTCEKVSGQSQPARNSASTSTWNDLTAPSTEPYMPIRSRIKLPEIPGKIIAQIAIAPAIKTLMLVGSILQWLKHSNAISEGNAKQ